MLSRSDKRAECLTPTCGVGFVALIKNKAQPGRALHRVAFGLTVIVVLLCRFSIGGTPSSSRETKQ